MYLCLDCESVFEEPKYYTEKHDLDSPPYETWTGCPYCSGAYVKTTLCCQCEDWVTGKYIKLDDYTVICENCYEIKDIEDGGL